MKATGIVRRIDELGRVVIPKEIRKNLRIHEGENVEIYIDANENIILKKFSVIRNLKDFSQNLIDVIYSFFKYDIIITDNDEIIAASSSIKKKCINQPISNTLNNLIQKREYIIKEEYDNLELTENYQINGRYIIDSIIVHSDVVGLVILISENDTISELDEKIVHIVSNFFTKYLEE